MFCSACREILSTKKSVLNTHISSMKRYNGEEKLKQSKLKEQTIIVTFKGEEYYYYGLHFALLCHWKNQRTDLKWSVSFCRPVSQSAK